VGDHERAGDSRGGASTTRPASAIRCSTCYQIPSRPITWTRRRRGTRCSPSRFGKPGVEGLGSQQVAKAVVSHTEAAIPGCRSETGHEGAPIRARTNVLHIWNRLLTRRRRHPLSWRDDEPEVCGDGRVGEIRGVSLCSQRPVAGCASPESHVDLKQDFASRERRRSTADRYPVSPSLRVVTCTAGMRSSLGPHRERGALDAPHCCKPAKPCLTFFAVSSFIASMPGNQELRS
jgi:hypothetical protein